LFYNIFFFIYIFINILLIIYYIFKNIVLIYGTFIFNGIVSLPFQITEKNDGNLGSRNESRPLLDENPSPITPDEDNHFANI